MSKIHILVKRKKFTVFLRVELTETTLQIKEKLRSIIDVSPDKMLLTIKSLDLQDSKTLGEQGVKNDCVIALRYKLEDGTFEPVDITSPDENP